MASPDRPHFAAPNPENCRTPLYALLFDDDQPAVDISDSQKAPADAAEPPKLQPPKPPVAVAAASAAATPLGLTRQPKPGACASSTWVPPGRANGAPSDGASAAPPTSASASASQSATGSDEEPLISAEEALTRSWKSGFIFFCRHDSFRETFERRIFGLGAHKRDLVANVDPGTTALFLFDQTFRYIHGVYEAAEQPGYDLDPQYLRHAGKAPPAGGGDGAGSPFPVQVRFRRVHDFAPLAEVKWCHMVSYNQGTNVFRHRLGEKATSDLLRLLAHPEEAPSGNVLPYETNGYRRTIPENARFREQRRAAYGE